MDEAGLYRRQLPGGRDRLREAFQPVTDDDADVFDTTVLDLSEHSEPVFGALAAVAGPDTEDAPFPGSGDTDSNVERPVRNLPITDFHDDGVNEHHWIDAIQGPVGPLAISSMILSVILLIVSFDTRAP